MNLKMALAVCLTVDAGCIRNREKVEQYNGQCGSKQPGGICYNL